MNQAASNTSILKLEPFSARYARSVADWVKSDLELAWLAPATSPPLTAAKVISWVHADRRAFLLTDAFDTQPLGYAELNPMRFDPAEMWIGHVIIRPDKRGFGLGRDLVRRLLERAFVQKSVGRVSLIVSPDNSAALNCYRRVGFAVVGQEEHAFGASQVVHSMLRLEFRRERLT